MTEPRKRHRWKASGDHFYPGPKYWNCVQCGLTKVTEWEEKPYYMMSDSRRWHRFAPPCPPPPDLPPLTSIEADRLARDNKRRAKVE
jgi:hypothetical protein